MSRAVVLFLRTSEKGRVKTRLAADVGEERALSVYRELLEIAARASDGTGAPVLCFLADEGDPHDLGLARATWQRQRGTDLGERMQQAFVQAFSEGHQQVVLIGSDLPHMSTDLLVEAFDALMDHDAVLGPARDGGYYLLGLKRPLPGLFTGMPWSTDQVLPLTRERLRGVGADWKELRELRDVDDGDDLAAWEAERR